MPKPTGTNQLTLGDTIYQTKGNILFSKDGETEYYLAESPILNKMDKVIQDGILENGMQTLLKKLRG